MTHRARSHRNHRIAKTVGREAVQRARHANEQIGDEVDHLALFVARCGLLGLPGRGSSPPRQAYRVALNAQARKLA